MSLPRPSPASSHTQLPEQDKEWDEARTPPNDEEAALPPPPVAEKERDPNIVDWEGDDDKENPRNWSSGYKSWITVQLGLLALSASLGSSIIAPGEADIAAYTGVSSEVVVLSISLYMLVFLV